MLAVIVKSYVKKKDLAEFIEVSKTHAKLSAERDEGCIRFDVAEPIGEEVAYIEIWENGGFLQKHSERGAIGLEVPKINELRYDKKVEIYNI